MKTILFSCLLLTLSLSQAEAKDKLGKMRQKVWAQWCADYLKREPQQLPQLTALNDKQTFCWQIPDTLEHNATMHFYHGTKGDAPEQGYPLFLYLHGSGPSAREWETGWHLAKGFHDSPALYYIPRIPNEGQLYRWWQRGKQWVWERLLRIALIQGHIDPARIYLFGISEGGYGSQRLASYYADYLAAAGPMAGGEPLQNAPAENLSNLAFSFLTGELDATYCRNQLTSITAQALDSLAARYPGQYPHRVELVPGRGHGIDYSVTTPWLLQHKRNATPTRFRWENYEMDGVKRNNFYNLEVVEEEGTAYRTFYDFEVKDNVVSLQVSSVQYEVGEKDPRWGIPLRFRRTLSPAQHGKVIVFLSETMIDLKQPVTIRVNGRTCHQGRLKANRKAMQRSAALWGDPLRLFPTLCEVEW